MKRIVVGIDGSEGSRHALDRALRIGQLTGRTVELMTFWATTLPAASGLGPGYMWDPEAAHDQAESLATQLLDQELALAFGRRASDLPVTVQATAREALVGPGLADASEEAALVVIGTKGRTSMGNVLLSSLADVVRGSSCPVLVVPTSTPTSTPYRRVVVGLDGSSSSSAALHWGYAMARLEQAELLALHAAGVGELPIRVEQVRGWHSKVADEIAAGAELDCDVRVVAGHPEKVLATAVGADDLLVVGSRGAGAVSSMVLGSVSSSCLSHPGSSVLVVKEHDAPLAAELEPLALAADDA